MTRRVRIHLLVTALVVTILTPLHDLAAQPAPTYHPFPPSWQSELDKLTKGEDGTVATAESPGVLMLVDSPRWGTMLGTSGYADIANKTKPAPDMHYRIGSMSKMFTALTVLSLEEEGRLRLTDSVDKYLEGSLALGPQFQPSKVTIADCLRHTGGMSSYLVAPYFKNVPFEEAPTINQVPQILMQQNNLLDPVYPVGTTYANPFEIFQQLYQGKDVAPAKVQETKSFPQRYPWWLYSNSGYLCLGIVIESVTGQKLADVMQERVMDKLGLKNTYFATDSSTREPMMRGYSRLNSGMQPYDPPKKDWVDRTVIDPSYAWSAGAVMSTPHDMLAFLKGVFTTEKVLRKRTKEKWFTFVTADLLWQNMDYGQGALMQNQQPFGMLRGHGGSIPGFNNLCYYMPDADTFFVTVANTWDSHNEVAMMDAVMPLVGDAVFNQAPPNNSMFQPKKDQKSFFAWMPGRVYGDSYNLILGTKRDEVVSATTPTATTTESTILLPNSGPGEYYWRVDTVTADRTVTGPVWKFTILPE